MNVWSNKYTKLSTKTNSLFHFSPTLLKLYKLYLIQLAPHKWDFQVPNPIPIEFKVYFNNKYSKKLNFPCWLYNDLQFLCFIGILGLFFLFCIPKYFFSNLFTNFYWIFFRDIRKNKHIKMLKIII